MVGARYRIKNFNIYFFTYYSIAISSVLTAFIAFVRSAKDGLWILPLLFFGCFSLIFKKRYCTKYSIIIMNLIAYIRYVILTFMYYFFNDNYILPNGAVILSYIPEKIDNHFEIVLLMSLEMAIFYMCLFVGTHCLFKNEIKIKNDYAFGIFEISIVVLGIISIISKPQLLGVIRFLKNVGASDIWGLVAILVYLAKIFLGIWIIRFIKYRIHIKNCYSLIFSVVIFLGLILEGSIGLTGLISRWGFVLSVVPCLYLLQKLYPEYFMKIFFCFGILGFIFMILMTVSRYNFDAYNGNVGFRERIINYKTFNTYFAGEVSMEQALKANELYKDEISILTISHDILGSCPFLNKFLTSKSDNSTYYFNYSIYKGVIYGDQICPVGGQAILYLGHWAVGIFAGIFAIIAMWFERRAEISDKILAKYIFIYAAGVTSIIMCINISIWFQFFWQKILPLLVLNLVDNKVHVRQ